MDLQAPEKPKRTRNRRTTSAIDRVLRRVVYDHGCWKWTGATVQGYGSVGVGRRGQSARAVHRVTYEALVRPLNAGEQVDHLCRNTLCCNPLHLEAVQPVDNVRRSTAGQWQKRKTACPRGHVYDDANTAILPGNRRDCRECMRQRQRDYYARKAAK
jgi:hypothetical protein